MRRRKDPANWGRVTEKITGSRRKSHEVTRGQVMDHGSLHPWITRLWRSVGSTRSIGPTRSTRLPRSCGSTFSTDSTRSTRLSRSTFSLPPPNSMPQLRPEANTSGAFVTRPALWYICRMKTANLTQVTRPAPAPTGGWSYAELVSPLTHRRSVPGSFTTSSVRKQFRESTDDFHRRCRLAR